MGMNYEQEYNRVMGLLQNTKMPHGLCEPRERKACTHCNAVEELDKLIAEYKGARIVLAGAATTTSTQPEKCSVCGTEFVFVPFLGGYYCKHGLDERVAATPTPRVQP